MLVESQPTTRAFRELDSHMLGWPCDGARYFAPQTIEIALIESSALRKEAA